MNCEVDVVFLWEKDCVLIGHHNTITEVNLITTRTKFYVPAVTLYLTNSINSLKTWSNNSKERDLETYIDPK